MADVVAAVKAAWIAALRSDPEISGVTVCGPEAPRADLPRIDVAEPASSEWGAKGASGRELRMAAFVRFAPGQFGRCVAIAWAAEGIEERVARDLPGGWRIASATFLRSRGIEGRPLSAADVGLNAILIEHRVRVLRVN